MLYTRSRPQHVTLDAPSFDTELLPVLARAVRRDEIANGLVEFVPLKPFCKAAGGHEAALAAVHYRKRDWDSGAGHGDEH